MYQYVNTITISKNIHNIQNIIKFLKSTIAGSFFINFCNKHRENKSNCLIGFTLIENGQINSTYCTFAKYFQALLFIFPLKYLHLKCVQRIFHLSKNEQALYELCFAEMHSLIYSF